MTGSKMKRRDFIGRSVMALSGISIVPRHVLGGINHTAPSDQLTKAIIGVGGMGRGHIPYENTPVVAICDVDKLHLQKAADQLKNKGVRTYADYRELLQQPDIDIVHIATPPHWHGIMAVEAAKAGKDIWCEKPMTRTIGEGIRVVEDVNRHGGKLSLNSFRLTFK